MDQNKILGKSLKETPKVISCNKLNHNFLIVILNPRLYKQ